MAAPYPLLSCTTWLPPSSLDQHLGLAQNSIPCCTFPAYRRMFRRVPTEGSSLGFQTLRLALPMCRGGGLLIMVVSVSTMYTATLISEVSTHRFTIELIRRLL